MRTIRVFAAAYMTLVATISTTRQDKKKIKETSPILFIYYMHDMKIIIIVKKKRVIYCTAKIWLPGSVIGVLFGWFTVRGRCALSIARRIIIHLNRKQGRLPAKTGVHSRHVRDACGGHGVRMDIYNRNTSTYDTLKSCVSDVSNTLLFIYESYRRMTQAVMRIIKIFTESFED